MDIGFPEILIVLVVVLLVFGPGRIAKVAGELGSGIRNFRQGLESANPEKKQPDDESNSTEKDESAR
jgi:sec-independent protein translocase protein TatA